MNIFIIIYFLLNIKDIHLTKLDSSPLVSDTNFRLYLMYPQNVIYYKNISTLQNIKLHLKIVKYMNFNAVHILPFLESSNRDKGYDIKNYFKIDPKYGNLNDLKEVVDEANKLNIYLFMDLVFNHLSYEYEWFQKAINGSSYYKNLFYHSNEKPKYLKEKSNITYAAYQIETDNFNKTVFQYNFNQVENLEIPHWEKYNSTWYFHSFYKTQIDLNWANENVYDQFKNIIEYWAKFGFNFRLDVISILRNTPYYDYVNFSNRDYNFIITKKIIHFVKKINPNILIISEAIQQDSQLVDYFKLNLFSFNYNFELNTNIWKSFIFNNKSYIEEIINNNKNYPEMNKINYVRHHDEIALLSPKEFKLMYKSFSCKHLHNNSLPNYEFSKGFVGTTFSLVCLDINKFKFIYSILFSISKNILIPSGDEVLKINDSAKNLPKNEKQDSRNIARKSINFIDELNSIEKRNNIEFVKTMINMANKYIKDVKNIIFLNNYPDYVLALKHILNKQKSLYCILNLSGKNVFEINLTKNIDKIIFSTEIIKYKNNSLILNPHNTIWFLSYN